MNRYVLVLVLLFTSVSQAQAEDFWHDSVRACVVGGGVVGASSALLLYSAAAAATAGATAVMPSSAIVFGNTIFGCGLATMGTMLIYGIGSFYQGMVSTSQSIMAPESSVPTTPPVAAIAPKSEGQSEGQAIEQK